MIYAPAHRAVQHPTNLRTLWLSQFVNTAGLMALVPIMPLYMESLGAEPSTVGLWAGAAIAAPALPLAVTTPLWGRLGDRIGAKWMVVRALVGLAIAMSVMAAAASPAVLVLARILQGTLGGVVEAAAAFVGSQSDRSGTGKALGRSYSASAAGALIGPLAGGVLVSSGQLRPLLMTIGFVALALAVVAGLRLSSIRVRGSTGEDEIAHSSSLINTCNRIGWRPLGAGFLAFLGVYGLLPVYAPYVNALVGDADSAGAWVGALHTVMWVGTFAGSLWWGRLNDERGRPLWSVAAASAVTAAVVLTQAWTTSLPLLGFLRLVQGFCFGALAQSLFLHAASSAPDDQTAGHVSTANSFLLIGQFAGPLATGAMLAVTSPSVTATIAGITVAVGAALLRRQVAVKAELRPRGRSDHRSARPPIRSGGR